MTFSTLRAVQFAAATLLSAAVLLLAVAPALFAASPNAARAAGVHGTDSAGIECLLPPESPLV